MTKIAETYLRLDINVKEKDRIELQRYLEKQARYYAKDLFHQEIDFLVRVEEGSIKIWVLIGGIIFTNAVSDYGSFRTGIDYIIKDARLFSENVMKDAKQSGITEREIARFERRLGVPGKIKRVFKKLEKLHSKGRDLSTDMYDKEIALVQKNLFEVFRQIDTKNDSDLIIKNIPSKIRDSLPELPQLPNNVAMPKIALRPEEWDTNSISIALPNMTQTFKKSNQKLTKDNLYEIRTTNSGIKFLAPSQQ